MLTAVLGSLGMDLVLAVRLLGFIFTLSSLYLIVDYLFRNYRANFVPISVVVLFLFSLSSVISVWTIAGLEQPLFCYLVLSSIIYYLRYNESGLAKYLWISSLSLGLVSITRPDGLLFAFVIAIYHLLGRNGAGKRQKLNILFKLSIFSILLFSSQLIFRIIYYNEIVPNTALVKISPSIPHFIDGVMYNLRFAKTNISLIIFAIASIIIAFKYKRKNIYFYLLLLSSWLFYISFIGGDIFVAFRHHYMTILILLLIIADGMDTLLKTISLKKVRLILLPISIILLILYSYQQFMSVNYTVVRQLNWHWETKTLSDELKLYFADQQPLIAVDAAGSLAYWTEFPALDMLGLNDYHIARKMTAKVGSGQIGHELGDDQYIMSRNPDIIQVHVSYDVPIHYADSLLFRNKRFIENYAPIGLSVKGEYPYKGVLWFNKRSKIVGIDSNRTQIIIPSYYFVGKTRIYSEFSKEHQLVTPVSTDDTLEYFHHGLLSSKEIRVEPYSRGLNVQINHLENSTLIQITNSSNDIRYFERIVINKVN